MSTHDKARIGFARWDAVVVLLALTVLVGCQGLSAGKSSTPAPQQNNSPGSLGVNPRTLGQQQDSDPGGDEQWHDGHRGFECYLFGAAILTQQARDSYHDRRGSEF